MKNNVSNSIKDIAISVANQYRAYLKRENQKEAAKAACIYQNQMSSIMIEVQQELYGCINRFKSPHFFAIDSPDNFIIDTFQRLNGNEYLFRYALMKQNPSVVINDLALASYCKMLNSLIGQRRSALLFQYSIEEVSFFYPAISNGMKVAKMIDCGEFVKLYIAVRI